MCVFIIAVTMDPQEGSEFLILEIKIETAKKNLIFLKRVLYNIFVCAWLSLTMCVFTIAVMMNNLDSQEGPEFRISEIKFDILQKILTNVLTFF